MNSEDKWSKCLAKVYHRVIIFMNEAYHRYTYYETVRSRKYLIRDGVQTDTGGIDLSMNVLDAS